MLLLLLALVPLTLLLFPMSTPGGDNENLPQSLQ
jgi:hypothetical protein